MSPITMNSNFCNVCFFSKLSQKKTKRTCSHCKLISYCGIEHQKLDWPIHKDFCRAVKTIMEKNSLTHPHFINGKIVDRNDLEKAIVILKNCILYCLKRNLYTHEDELITFPKYCAICLNFKTDQNLNCYSCHAVSYCSEKCKELDSDDYGHRKICQKLKILYNFYEEEEEFNLMLNCTMLNLKIENENNIISYLKNFIPHKISITNNPNNLDEYQRFVAACSYSCVMTILHVIEYCQISLNCRNNCTIYIVGVRDDYQWFQEKHCKFLISQMLNVKYLKLIFIGPELKANKFNHKYTFNIDGITKIVQLNMYCEKYEKYLEMQNLNPSKETLCNLLICFNCGFAEYANTPNHTWGLALKKFFEMKRTPIAFTSYTLMESKLDLKEILSVAQCGNEDCTIIIKTEKNRFKDLRPLRNWEITDLEDDLIFHHNGYLNVFIPKCRFT